MKKIRLTINRTSVEVIEGSTILEAAGELGISIPTLCHRKDFAPNTSCMLCVVRDIKKERLVPSCSMPAEEGMEIETDSEIVRDSRRDTLSLLLSEHVGNCEAPCRLACPSHLDIPLMIRQIREGRFLEAAATIKRDIALPSVMPRICSAPCEKACYRSHHDNPVAIRLLKKFVSDLSLNNGINCLSLKKPETGKKTAVVGSGPAGLSAAYFIALEGHICHVYDSSEKPGGMLRNIPEDKLPSSILDKEIDSIKALGIEFRMGGKLGRDFSLSQLKDKYDAIVLATGGQTEPDFLKGLGVEFSEKGITVNPKSFETSVAGVFAGGNAIYGGRSAMRSASQGKNIAFSVNRFISGFEVAVPPTPFNSLMGKIKEGETEDMLKIAEIYDRVQPEGIEGYSEQEAVCESKRCFQCDCSKATSCGLREYSGEYRAERKKYAFEERKNFSKIVQQGSVIFEPGKCIKCNICVEIVKRAGVNPGISFVNRGFDMILAVPFGESFDNGLDKAAEECINSCPTGALSWRQRK